MSCDEQSPDVIGPIELPYNFFRESRIYGTNVEVSMMLSEILLSEVCSEIPFDSSGFDGGLILMFGVLESLTAVRRGAFATVSAVLLSVCDNDAMIVLTAALILSSKICSVAVLSALVSFFVGFDVASTALVVNSVGGIVELGETLVCFVVSSIKTTTETELASVGGVGFVLLVLRGFFVVVLRIGSF